MGAIVNLGTANFTEHNAVLATLTELMNAQNVLIAQFEGREIEWVDEIHVLVNEAFEKMMEYSRRLLMLNRSILELTKRVRLTLLRAQALADSL